MSSRKTHIDWSELPLWCAQDVAGTYCVKVADTSTDTHIVKSQQDNNCSLDVHASTGDRVVGYSLKTRRLRSGKPAIAIGDHFIGAFYSTLKSKQRQTTMSVTYHDQNVRFLVFDRNPYLDYLLVLRNRN